MIYVSSTGLVCAGGIESEHTYHKGIYDDLRSTCNAPRIDKTISVGVSAGRTVRDRMQNNDTGKNLYM